MALAVDSAECGGGEARDFEDGLAWLLEWTSWEFQFCGRAPEEPSATVRVAVALSEEFMSDRPPCLMMKVFVPVPGSVTTAKVPVQTEHKVSQPHFVQVQPSLTLTVKFWLTHSKRNKTTVKQKAGASFTEPNFASVALSPNK